MLNFDIRPADSCGPLYLTYKRTPDFAHATWNAWIYLKNNVDSGVACYANIIIVFPSLLETLKHSSSNHRQIVKRFKRVCRDDLSFCNAK